MWRIYTYNLGYGIQIRGRIMKDSIRFKLTILLFALTGGIIFVITILNTTFLGRFYYLTKQSTMEKTYYQIDNLYQSIDYDKYQAQDTEVIEEIKLELEKICSKNNVNIQIIDFNHHTIFNSGMSNEAIEKVLNAYIYSINISDSTIITKSDDYVLTSNYDSRLGVKTLNLVGDISYNNFVIMTTTVESIQDAIKFSNRFVEYIGLVVMIIGVIVATIFAKKIAKPIIELSDIAEKMAELDFDVKYTSNDKGELGILGNSMNKLSDNLEQTISKLKSANISLQRDIEKKEMIDEMRKEFVSNVSHELKTPIALIQGYAEGLKEGISDDPESMEFYCDVIIDEAAKMNNMVKKLLTLQHIESGTEKVTMDRFDIVPIISSVVKSNKLLADGKDIRIIFNQKDPIYVWADEYQIEEVLTNYVSNAINHATNDKIIRIDTNITNGVLRVNVYNTGANIPEDELDKVWIKFYKVDKARTREYGGSGIGLSIVKAIMESFGQKCGVYNTEDGVVFWFELDCKS